MDPKKYCKKGDCLRYEHLVENNDTATFTNGQVHPVYATFALGRDAEWACRQFVLQIKEEHEEGIGTQLHIVHHAPAFCGEKVVFSAFFETLVNNKLTCTFEAHVGNRLIASGSTEQKILPKEAINRLFENLQNKHANQ